LFIPRHEAEKFLGKGDETEKGEGRGTRKKRRKEKELTSQKSLAKASYCSSKKSKNPAVPHRVKISAILKRVRPHLAPSSSPVHLGESLGRWWRTIDNACAFWMSKSLLY
jgi:hypothetical protein